MKNHPVAAAIRARATMGTVMPTAMAVVWFCLAVAPLGGCVFDSFDEDDTSVCAVLEAIDVDAGISVA